jgi:hypothetical protein
MQPSCCSQHTSLTQKLVYWLNCFARAPSLTPLNPDTKCAVGYFIMLNFFFAILNGALELSKDALPKVRSFLFLRAPSAHFQSSDF